MRHFFFVSFVCSLLLSACDICKDVDCQNGGECSEGHCQCLTGFSGNRCEYEDECITHDVTCQNGKPCDDAVCECGYWYFEEDCSGKLIAAYVGTYSGTWMCDSADSAVVKLKDIEGLDNKMVLSEAGTDRHYEFRFSDATHFSISEQKIYDEFGSPVVSGIGSLNDGVLWLSMDYNYSKQGGPKLHCVFNGSL